MFKCPLRCVAAGLLMTLCGTGLHLMAQSVPSGFNDAVVIGGFSAPVGFTFDANGRMYVWEKQGKVWIVENGVRLPSPLIDISEEVGNWRDHGCPVSRWTRTSSVTAISCSTRWIGTT